MAAQTGRISVASSRKMSRTKPSITYAEIGPRIKVGNEDDDLIGFDISSGGPIIVLDGSYFILLAFELTG